MNADELDSLTERVLGRRSVCLLVAPDRGGDVFGSHDSRSVLICTSSFGRVVG